MPGSSVSGVFVWLTLIVTTPRGYQVVNGRPAVRAARRSCASLIVRIGLQPGSREDSVPDVGKQAERFT